MDPAWAFGVAFIIVALSLRNALPRLLTSVAEKNEADKVAEHSASVEEVEELRHRLAEVEERLDFAERMLAQQQEPGRLPKADG